MFLCQPLVDVLIARRIEDIDSFIQPLSWNDLSDSESIPGMTGAVDRVLTAVRGKQQITIFGDYDCDGILGTHILRWGLASFGVPVWAHLPHRDEGSGKHFDEQLALLEPFGEGNPAPVFLLRGVEVAGFRNRWVRIRQGRFSLEALCWDLAPQVGMRGSCLIEFRGKRRVLKSFREGDQHGSRAI